MGRPGTPRARGDDIPPLLDPAVADTFSAMTTTPYRKAPTARGPMRLEDAAGTPDERLVKVLDGLRHDANRRCRATTPRPGCVPDTRVA
jgi:hypothetical protein